LITLVIIGVVAALTVPNMMVKHQKEETATKLKKEYSVLSQTIIRAVADYGETKTWDLADDDPDVELPEDDLSKSETLTVFLNKYMVPYLSLMKKPTNSTTGHWDNKYYNIDKTETNYNPNAVRMYLNDGASVTMDLILNNATTKLIYVFIDINGDKKPNRLGRDIFLFQYYIKRTTSNSANRLYPPYGIYTRNEQFDICKNEGLCAALIMRDGWQIKDDYPW